MVGYKYKNVRVFVSSHRHRKIMKGKIVRSRLAYHWLRLRQRGIRMACKLDDRRNAGKAWGFLRRQTLYPTCPGCGMPDLPDTPHLSCDLDLSALTGDTLIGMFRAMVEEADDGLDAALAKPLPLN